MRWSALLVSGFARLRRHCSHSELVAFQCASLDDDAAQRTARHVADCPRCSSKLERIRADFDMLERTLSLDSSLATVAAEDWPRLLDNIRSAPAASRPSPEILASYLGNYGRSAAEASPAPMEVLQTLLGARATAAVSSVTVSPSDGSESCS